MRRNVLDTPKPIIALLHLDALPGDPDYCGNMQLVLDHARTDLENLQNGGVDGILFSNEFSFPYEGRLSHVTTSAMAYIIGSLKDEIRIPFGIHAIADNDATIDLACAVEADFVRGVFTGAYVGEGGYFSTDLAHYVRRKKELGRYDLQMFFMANAESDADISGRSLDTIIPSLVFKCNPDAICLSGMHAGKEADSSSIRRMHDLSNGIPIFANTGCNYQNIAEKLKICDGAFIGTGFKKDGLFRNHTDAGAVTRFMDRVREVRAALN